MGLSDRYDAPNGSTSFLSAVMVLRSLLVELYTAPTAMRAGFGVGGFLQTATSPKPMKDFDASLVLLTRAAMRAEAQSQGIL